MRGKFFAVLILSALSSWADIRLTEPGQPVAIGGKGIVFSEKPFSPADLPGLAAWYSADFGVLNSVGPDVAATEGQTVRRWLDRSGNGRHADQTVLANQPIFTNSTTGITFDGVSQFMDGTSTMASVFQNKGYGYIFAVCQDTNPASGASIHYPVYFSNGTLLSQARAGILSRLLSNSLFGVASRRLDADAFTNATFASDSNLNVLEAQFLWADNVMRIFRNGSSTASAAYPSGAGNTSNTASLLVSLGNDGSNRFPGNIREIVIINEQLNEGQILKLRQYLARKWGISL